MNLDTVSITLTYYCNLKCKNCSMCIPYYSNPKQFSSDYIRQTAEHLFSFVAHISKVTLAGGEPLLHNELPEIIKAILSFGNKFSVLEIVTNGTIIPGKELQQVFKENQDKIRILVDNYGEPSSKVAEISRVLTDINAAFQVRKYYGEDMHCNGWVDFGDFSRTADSETDAKKLFAKCAIPSKLNCLQISDGKIYRCSRSRRCNELGISSSQENESLDLLSGLSDAQKQERLKNLLKLDVLSGCYFCNGMTDTTPRVIPGEQL